MGKLSHSGFSLSRSGRMVAAIVGQIAIFGCGVLWLKSFVPNWSDAFMFGVFPFFWGELFKTFLVVFLPDVLRFAHSR